MWLTNLCLVTYLSFAQPQPTSITDPTLPTIVCNSDFLEQLNSLKGRMSELDDKCQIIKRISTLEANNDDIRKNISHLHGLTKWLDDNRCACGVPVTATPTKLQGPYLDPDCSCVDKFGSQNVTKSFCFNNITLAKTPAAKLHFQPTAYTPLFTLHNGFLYTVQQSNPPIVHTINAATGKKYQSFSLPKSNVYGSHQGSGIDYNDIHDTLVVGHYTILLEMRLEGSNVTQLTKVIGYIVSVNAHGKYIYMSGNFGSYFSLAVYNQLTTSTSYLHMQNGNTAYNSCSFPSNDLVVATSHYVGFLNPAWSAGKTFYLAQPRGLVCSPCRDVIVTAQRSVYHLTRTAGLQLLLKLDGFGDTSMPADLAADENFLYILQRGGAVLKYAYY